MVENKKTIIFVVVAVVLAVIAYLVAPSRITPDVFLDQGEPFFPEFNDPAEAAVLEVIDFDESSGRTEAFKVVNNNGNWTIPSHHNYPADGEERLAKTAAGVIGIVKDDFRTDNISDHEALGVIDPLDETAGLNGRGKRITLKDANNRALADFIIGKEIEGRRGFRFVRVPDQKRVYAVKMDIDISTRFEDWIETDLLKVNTGDIRQVVLNDYSIDERTGRLDQRDKLVLNMKDEQWVARGMKSSQTVDTLKMDTLLKTLDELTIVGVRSKPEGLSANLKQVKGETSITQSDVRSLQSKGFYFSRDGKLLSNEGELQMTSNAGVIYTLRFGEVVYGSGEMVSSGTAESEKDKNAPAENRYLFITADFDETLFPEPKEPGNMDFLGRDDTLLTAEDRENKEKYEAHLDWQHDVEEGRTLSNEMNRRFADWYYVISAESFDKLHLKRNDLLVKK